VRAELHERRRQPGRGRPVRRRDRGRIAVGPTRKPRSSAEFGAGEYFRLDSANAIPTPLFTPPSFFWDKLEPQARSGGKTFAGIPWKPAPGAPSDPPGPVASDPTGSAGSLLRTDGSLTLSPINRAAAQPGDRVRGSHRRRALRPRSRPWSDRLWNRW